MDMEKHCCTCSARLRRKRIGISERLEDMKIFLNRKYCNRKCMSVGKTKPIVLRGTYSKRARKFRKSNCELCGTTERLSIHHKDRNWSNNNLNNLQTLCASCHTLLHHAAGEICPKKGERPCLYCARISTRRVCRTCQSRTRTHGHDYAMRKGKESVWNRSSLIAMSETSMPKNSTRHE